ncbi:MAG: hypothetical protein ACRYGR_00805 [Janthinobacterium lividum]
MVVQFNGRGQPISFDGAATPPNIFINWDPLKTNAEPNNIRLNLGAVGTFTGIFSRPGGFNVIKNSNDGKPYGKFERVTVDCEGYVYPHFNNKVISKIYYVPNIQ